MIAAIKAVLKPNVSISSLASSLPEVSILLILIISRFADVFA